MTLFTHSFLESPSMMKCLKIVCSEGNNFSDNGATIWSHKTDEGDMVLEQVVGHY
jgi:hypothetical protein